MNLEVVTKDSMEMEEIQNWNKQKQLPMQEYRQTQGHIGGTEIRKPHTDNRMIETEIGTEDRTTGRRNYHWIDIRPKGRSWNVEYCNPLNLIV